MKYNPLFNKCIGIILKNEGGYINHVSDPGGETNMGIAKKFFPDEDIKNMTVERAREIYYTKYWIPMNLAGIENDELVLQIFDFGINAGRKRAIMMVQKLVYVVSDGICGTITKAAINKSKRDMLVDYKKARKGYYNLLAIRNEKLHVFLKGWLNRVDHTHL